MSGTPAHVAGFDDAPFPPGWRGDVAVVGAVYAGARLDGVLTLRVRRDGRNATTRIARAVRESQFHAHLHLVMLQGIAVAGFNVVDLQGLAALLDRPVLVVARRAPDLERIRRALLTRVPGGARKWRLIQAAGPMEPVAGVYVQRAGLSLDEAEAAVRRFAVHGAIPEPLRTAHLIAGALATGRSHGRT